MKMASYSLALGSSAFIFLLAFAFHAPAVFAACVVPTLAQKSGGMTYVNWHFNTTDINSLRFSVEIKNNPGENSHLFLQLYDGNIDNTAQYFGLQTTGTVLFSRFGTGNTGNASVPSGSNSTVVADADQNNAEGAAYVSVRRNFGLLPAGTYTVRMVRDTYDGAGDWFKYYVTFPGGVEQYIGALRFPRGNAGTPASFRDGGGTWTEFWDNNGSTLNTVPLWSIRTSVRANSGVVPVRAVASYSSMPNSDIYAASAGGFVDHKLGACTPRLNPSGVLWDTSADLPDLTASALAISPAVPVGSEAVSLSGTIANTSANAASRSPGFPNTFQIVKVDRTASSSSEVPVPNNRNAKVDMTSLVRVAGNPPISSLVGNTTFNPPVSASHSFSTFGTYAIRLCANINAAWNRDDSVSESSSGNNCTIPWQLVTVLGAGGNQSPLAPTIGGAAVGPPDTSYSFSAHDPEDGALKYQIDWDNNGSADEEAPGATTYAPSDTSVNQARNWRALGTKTFQARAVDAFGSISEWTTRTVEIRCDPRTTWSPVDTACLDDVIIDSFASAPSVETGRTTYLSAGRIAGDGTITCSIDQGVGAVSLTSSGGFSKESLPLTTSTTFTLTCGNGVGPTVSHSTATAVGSTPVNGACGGAHNSCSSGTTEGVGETPSTYVWSCTGSNGGTNASCSETKTFASAIGSSAGAVATPTMNDAGDLIVGGFGAAGIAIAASTALNSFGGLDLFRYPATCSIPPFVPSCDFVKLDGCGLEAGDSIGVDVLGEIASTKGPLFFFDLFAPLYSLVGPGTGILAIPIGMKLLFPNYILFPGEWVLGTLAPATPVGGFYIPPCTFAKPPPPYSVCTPPLIDMGFACCLPSMCIPIAPSVSTVLPFTGAVTGGFSF